MCLISIKDEIFLSINKLIFLLFFLIRVSKLANVADRSLRTHRKLRNAHRAQCTVRDLN